MHHNSEIITTEYLDRFQYVDEDLQFFPIPIAIGKGYVRKTDGTNRKWFDYVYNYTDHLGNIRLSYTTDPLAGGMNNIKILEENNYYPFGLKHGRYNTPARDIRPLGEGRDVVMVNNNPYQYKYNGKEWQDELGLNVTAMDFRQYDNALGRFLNPDALSELYYSHTPYNFVGSNPKILSDPTGLLWYQNQETDRIEYFYGTAERDGWTLLGTAVSYFDDKSGNWVNGNTEYDNDGNEMGGTVNIVGSDGNILEMGIVAVAKSKKKSLYQKLIDFLSPPESRGVWWTGVGYGMYYGGAPIDFMMPIKLPFKS